jgi:hypothetical protein
MSGRGQVAWMLSPARTGTWRAPRTIGLLGAVLVAVLAAVAVALDAPHVIRLVFGLATIFWAPGQCAATLARVSDRLLFAVVAVAVSVSICTVVALTLFYLGIWHAVTVMVIMAAVTVAMAAVAWLEEGAR